MKEPGIVIVSLYKLISETRNNVAVMILFYKSCLFNLCSTLSLFYKHIFISYLAEDSVLRKLPSLEKHKT